MTTTTATDTVDSTVTASFGEGKGFIPMPIWYVSVLQIFHLIILQQTICLIFVINLD